VLPAVVGNVTDVRGLTGAVHSWDLSTGVDGPGTRFALFLSGCQLRCVYCQSPDTWSERDGLVESVDDVMTRIMRYRAIFERTGGGVTITGGEPLLQPRFTAAVVHACREEGIHTALDTSGSLGARATDDLLLDTDLVLLDIKSFLTSTYAEVTGGGNVTPTLQFARRLAALERPTWIRFVLVPGMNDAPENLLPLADFVATLGNVRRVDVLPFHKLGAAKYAAMGLPLPLADCPSPTAEQAASVRAVFRERGLTVT
jgi:pyruvate formate lyase activating enzyme